MQTATVKAIVSSPGCRSPRWRQGSLLYYRARYYDSQSGRFLSEDPLRFVAANNFYSYVENDPANLVDPTGHDSVTVGPVTFPLPWTRCAQAHWYCTNTMTPTQIAAEDAHEADDRKRWLENIPAWKKEQLGFAAELPLLRRRIAELNAKGCLTEAERRDLKWAQNDLDQADPIVKDDFAAKYYWNNFVRKWWQSEAK